MTFIRTLNRANVRKRLRKHGYKIYYYNTQKNRMSYKVGWFMDPCVALDRMKDINDIFGDVVNVTAEVSSAPCPARVGIDAPSYAVHVRVYENLKAPEEV